ncbi:MAG: ankyrin repeat domain-containing protein [Planctomycetales bacterium]|nr:ankyrin repeat domain-containing protein [Planctomycetales bacterium]
MPNDPKINPHFPQPNADQPVHDAAGNDPAELERLLNADPARRDEPGWFGRLPIHAAADKGNAASLQLLLASGASAVAKEGLHQQTPLHFAVGADSLACVNLLLQAGSDVNATDARGETPIFYAQSRSVIERLADAGAKLDVYSDRGQYAFQYCAAYIRSIEVMQFWLEHRVDLNHCPNFGWPALNALCGMVYTPSEVNDYKRELALLDLFVEHGANVSLLDKCGNSALFDACINRHFPLADRLLQRGADPNQSCRSGDTPLHAAVFRKHEELARLLLDHGADVNALNRHHQTPFDICPDDSIRLLLTSQHRPVERPTPTPEECIERLRMIPRFRHTVAETCTEEEISGLERQLGVPFPSAYRRFLTLFGQGFGDFMTSDRWTFQLNDLPEIGRDAEYDEYCDLPDNYFVFADRSGCFWVYFIADGKSDDPPVFAFSDGQEREARRIAESIWQFVESLVVDYELWSENEIE